MEINKGFFRNTLIPFFAKHKKTFNWLFALVLAIWLFNFLATQIKLNEIKNQLQQTPFYIYTIACIGGLINWGLEAKKWQLLINSLEKTSFWHAQKAAYAGAAVSNLFPFKIGEYLGKLYYVQKSNHIKSFGLSLFASLVQLLVNLILSALAAVMFFGGQIFDDNNLVYKLALLLVALTLLWIVYTKLGRKLPWVLEIKKGIKTINSTTALQLFSISLLRFICFASAYIFILMHFTQLPVSTVAMGVGTIYFLQSFSPGMVATDISVRLSLPLFVFANLAIDTNQTATGAVINYFFSVGMPSLFGLILVISALIKPRKNIAHSNTLRQG